MLDSFALEPLNSISILNFHLELFKPLLDPPPLQESLKVEIVSAKSSEMNVMVPVQSNVQHCTVYSVH